MLTVFITLIPGTIPTVTGYCYAEFTVNEVETTADSDVVKGSMVLSGACATKPAATVEVKREQLRLRKVTEAEARDGARTWIGKHILFERSTDDGNRVFTYGTVCNTRWTR